MHERTALKAKDLSAFIIELGEAFQRAQWDVFADGSGDPLEFGLFGVLCLVDVREGAVGIEHLISGHVIDPACGFGLSEP